MKKSTPDEEELLCSLIAEHRTYLLAYVERMVGDRHLAEDIVQETIIRAWQRVQRLHATEGSVRGWLLTVARNLVIDGARKASSRYEVLGESSVREPAEPDRTEAVLAVIESVRLLSTLPVGQREVLAHTYISGCTAEETAGILGVPAGTVKSRHHYALRRLRECA